MNPKTELRNVQRFCRMMNNYRDQNKNRGWWTPDHAARVNFLKQLASDSCQAYLRLWERKQHNQAKFERDNLTRFMKRMMDSAAGNHPFALDVQFGEK